MSPAPIAKGIIITVSVLVAAGIAVYESPEIRRWLNNSRRRIAVALYRLGDEIHPRDIVNEDISLTEDMSEDAQARRQQVREEISRKAALLKSRRKTSSLSSSSVAVSFDTLVDQDGRLRDEEPRDLSHGVGSSTAIEVGDSSSELMLRSVGSLQPEPSQLPALTEDRLQTQREILDAVHHDQLRLNVFPSDASSHHPSESLIDLTPTSEFPGTDGGVLDDQNSDRNVSSPRLGEQRASQSASDYFSFPSNHSGGGPESYYYTHPINPAVTAALSPLRDNAERAVSSASSVPGSLSHIHDNASSDGTLSEWGHSSAGIATPASWSEVGSVVSSNDGHHL